MYGGLGVKFPADTKLVKIVIRYGGLGTEPPAVTKLVKMYGGLGRNPQPLQN